MKFLRNIFPRRLEKAIATASDLLPLDVYAAIGSASIHVRGDDRPPVVVLSDGRSLTMKSSLKEQLSSMFPSLCGEQITTAERFLKNRVVANRVMRFELAQFDSAPRKRWSAKEW